MVYADDKKSCILSLQKKRREYESTSKFTNTQVAQYTYNLHLHVYITYAELWQKIPLTPLTLKLENTAVPSETGEPWLLFSPFGLVSEPIYNSDKLTTSHLL